MTTGYVIYNGPSELDHSSNVVAIVNTIGGESHNKKIGPLAQVWFLHGEMHPMEAIRAGSDAAICGNCVFARGNGCYVGKHVTSSVYRAWKNGSYPEKSPAVVGEFVALFVRAKRSAGLRLGAYGDPASVPFEVIDALASPVRAAGGVVVGYTHQWTEKYAVPGGLADPRLRQYAMASAHGPEEALEATQRGWRPFTVLANLEDRTAVQSPGFHLGICPASNEGKELRKNPEVGPSCASCGACDGIRSASDKRSGISVLVHGNASILRRAYDAMGLHDRKVTVKKPMTVKAGE